MADKIFTVTHFKEIVKPALSQRKIRIRKDEEEMNPGDNYEYAKHVASVIPLVRVGDFVIHRNNMNSFSIEIGNSFLPIITFNFKDEYQRCRRMLTSKKEFITVYYGNVADEYYIKQEYILSDIFCDPESDDVQMSGYLYVPEFYKQHIRYFNEENDAETSWKMIKKLCEECKLGFFTNIDETADAQTWIQDNCTTLDFFTNTIIPHAYNGDDTKLIFFIDQYDYLNVIDIKKAYQNRELEKTAKYPLTGLPIIENNQPVTKEVKLTTKRYDNEEAYPFKIGSFTTNFRYGSRLDDLPLRVQRNEYSISELPFKITPAELPTNTNEIDHKWYINKTFTDVHAHYNSVMKERPYIDMNYDQGDEVECRMVGAIMLLYPYMYCPLILTTMIVRPEYDEAESDDPVSSLDKRKPSIEEMELPDEMHSGDYIIRSIRYEFTNSTEENVQYVKLTRLPLEEIPQIKQW